MYTLVNCPSCGKETYKELASCPNCGFHQKPSRNVESLPTTSNDNLRSSSAFSGKMEYGVPFLAATIWAIGVLLYIAVAEPYGSTISQTESQQIFFLIALPAIAIFFATVFFRKVFGKTLHQKIVESANKWASDKKSTELQQFVDILKAMDAEEIGLPVAFAADFQNKLALKSINVKDPMFIVSKYPTLTAELSREVLSLQRQGREVEAAPIAIWIHTLRAVTHPELRGKGRELWRQLQRGFKYVEQAAYDFEMMTGRRLDIRGACEFPKGLTPDPLD